MTVYARSMSTAEECDPSTVATPPLIPLLEQREHHQFVKDAVPDVIAKLQRYVHENGIKILKEPRGKRKTKDQIRSNLTWENCRFCTWIWWRYKIMLIWVGKGGKLLPSNKWGGRLFLTGAAFRVSGAKRADRAGCASSLQSSLLLFSSCNLFLRAERKLQIANKTADSLTFLASKATLKLLKRHREGYWVTYLVGEGKLIQFTSLFKLLCKRLYTGLFPGWKEARCSNRGS